MKYLVSLKPLDSYFFGGEITFGESNTKTKANYFAKSNFMPQPSTILGVLRYEILRQNKLLNYSETENSQVIQKIGNQGFSMEEALASQDEIKYGIISNISPLFIAHKNSFYTVLPINYDIQTGTQAGNVYYSGKRGKNLLSFNPVPKEYELYQQWINAEKQNLSDKLKEKYPEQENLQKVFTKSQRIGIIKNKEGEEDKEAFFKQELITLHPDLSFVCTLETTETIKTGESKIFMGANRSIFSMKIEESSLDFRTSTTTNYFYKLHKDGWALLLGEAYISDKLIDEANFIWGESICFRNICKTVADGVTWNKPNKSNLYHLLPQGSVIYGNAKHLINKNLQNVGMNIFL